MFKTILVPLDGSLRAEAALPIAARIAQNSGARLVLVRVVSFVSEYWPTMTTSYPSMAQAAIETDLEEAAAYLERIASSPKLAGITVKTTAQFGYIAPTILSVAISYASDLIVLCSHGASGMIHWVMGSVAEKIVHHASIPVLVMREGGTHMGSTPADLAQPLRMLIPLDGSTGAQAALEPGAVLLKAIAAPGQQTALHLARVITPPRNHLINQQKNAGASSLNEELARARHSLERVKDQLQQGQVAPTIAEQHIPVTWSVIPDKDIAGALLRVAEQGEEMEGTGVFGGCELIAISTHGRAAFQNWALGSITERILHATRRPLLVVHPPKQSEENASLYTRERLISGSAVYG